MYQIFVMFSPGISLLWSCNVSNSVAGSALPQNISEQLDSGQDISCGSQFAFPLVDKNFIAWPLHDSLQFCKVQHLRVHMVITHPLMVDSCFLRSYSHNSVTLWSRRFSFLNMEWVLIIVQVYICLHAAMVLFFKLYLWVLLFLYTRYSCHPTRSKWAVVIPKHDILTIVVLLT